MGEVVGRYGREGGWRGMARGSGKARVGQGGGRGMAMVDEG